MATFFQRLRSAQQKHDSWLCIGLDPTANRIPVGIDVETFGKKIVDATAPYACAYKMNLAFYLAYGPEGMQALQSITAHVPDEIPVILDAKFGDIDYTAMHYARAAFEVFGADAVTVSPYVGMDAVKPLIDYKDKGVFVLVRSANTTSNDFQLWPSEQSPLFRYVTAQLNTLADTHPEQIGITVGATQPRDLTRLRCWAPTLPFLIPGLGEQEGDIALAVEHGITVTGIGPTINVGRTIIYASDDPGDFDRAAAATAHKWVDDIRAEREKQLA
ncbi:MAG TPA: orotidine-5'-phosphate decarboxylase [Aggregatilinea sp.]|jgi:orotidine-5'-phosphate decarboxylase|uniref:orotidine-5'-phosphate decarboxylase n=1 Tax=Aggregatilinea sp. TaxID=2806333 RepID=UPI002D1631A0|nr:orotidine-5'-phosphate decarboxylase [Aggregatilinea sp.]HML22171.1 orotidine-5'-phosphate decarboxylase [Aggregatilinea sp.]